MKILLKEPNKPFEVKEIENNLETLQQLVGGYIEVVPYKDNIAIICDEEDFISLTDKQIEEIIEGI